MEKDLFFYTSDDLIGQPVPWTDIGKSLSVFDKKMRKEWDNAVAQGLVRYVLPDAIFKKLDLQFGWNYRLPCVAQLNPQRASNRRKREPFDSMNDDFDEKQFNFTKIRQEETLLQVCPKIADQIVSEHKILLNVSPIAYGHILFVPFLEDRLPQRLTKDSLLLAFDLLQLSSQPSFRIGFNSLHAWASVNHLHYHGMYCDHEIFGDILPASEQLTGSCRLLDSSSPLPAFVFNVPNDVVERDKVATNATAITGHLHDASIPYNVTLNRGRLLRPDGTQSHDWTTRILIFPRKSSNGFAPADPFDVACVEVGGHFPVKTKEGFDSLTSTLALNALKEASLESLNRSALRKIVKDLLPE